MALTKNDLKQISLEITNALKKQKGEIRSSLAEALNRQKIEFTEALKEQKKESVAELADFLEKYVMEPIFGLKKDVSGLKKDVAILKKKTGGLEQNVSELKYETNNLRQEFSSVHQQLSSIRTQLEQKADIELINNVEKSILKRIDKLEENLRKEKRFYRGKIVNHEKRISRLEEVAFPPS